MSELTQEDYNNVYKRVFVVYLIEAGLIDPVTALKMLALETLTHETEEE